jgi:hypothetical protein
MRGVEHRSASSGRHRPALAALGEHVWADDRGERFTASLNAILEGSRRPGAPDPSNSSAFSELRKRS